MDKKRLQQEDDDAELQRLLEEKHPELFRVSESNVEPAKQTHNPTIADDTSQSREITINTSKIGGKEGVAELVVVFGKPDLKMSQRSLKPQRMIIWLKMSIFLTRKIQNWLNKIMHLITSTPLSIQPLCLCSHVGTVPPSVPLLFRNDGSTLC